MPKVAPSASAHTGRSSAILTRTKPFINSLVPPARSPVLVTRRSLAVTAAAAALSLFPMTPSRSTASTAQTSGPSGARDVSASAAPTPDASAPSSPVAGTPANLDLLVVGPGVLGSVLARDWLATVPGSSATGLTNTERSHDRLRAMGLQAATRNSLAPGRKWSFVVFSAPPSGSQDYVADVRSALDLWDGTGSFLFTSSASVFAVDDGGRVSEEHGPLVPQGAGPSTDKLLGAEAAVLQAGGNVLRLVGLYHANRGAHTFFIKAGTVSRPGDYLVNLLHYEDAAGLGAAVLRGDGSGPFRGRVFLGTDGHPVTFTDMMEYCFASGVFPRVPVAFTGSFPEGGKTGRGKVVDNAATRAALGGWAPRYASFKDFMYAGGKDFYSTSGFQF